ncbi:uncharacterized protein LOC113462762 isoform X6 [Phoenix dactylifera]|uniref:Uncharacterized protein LOC113462762 isoform X6 n=1 Tax=Phoenix dactylifera TaxID=42345 RepID=A0A8B9ALJ3_PHODC|nr:uncharacterized protein LOC113462762 isoform X6 [Phoenix dactylifera]
MALMATTTIGPTITSQRIRPHFSRVRVNLNGEETEKAFDDVVSNLAHAAPPIPGFCRMKGGLKKFSITGLWERPCCQIPYR